MSEPETQGHGGVSLLDVGSSADARVGWGDDVGVICPHELALLNGCCLLLQHLVKRAVSFKIQTRALICFARTALCKISFSPGV